MTDVDLDAWSAEAAATLVAAARRGDHAAFAAIVEHYDGRLRALAFHLLREPAAVDDALQETYLKAYRSLASYRGDAALGTWLHRIAYTTCLNAIRTRSRHAQPTEITLPDRPDPQADPADHVDRAGDLADLLETLPPDQRAAVVLVDAHGMSYARAAEILDISAGTLASRLNTARAVLRKELQARGWSLPSAPSMEVV